MDKKVINNAILAYFLMGFVLLLSRKKEDFKHAFIQSHAKTATVLHILMFISYVLFIWYKWFSSIPFFHFGISLNHILLMISLAVLLGINFYGAWLASQSQNFGIHDVTNITKTNAMVAMRSSNFSEKGAFVSILALIPFIGFTVKGQYASHKSIFLENNLKINLCATALISFLYISHPNLAQIFLLVYLCFIAFFGLLMIVQKKILDFSLRKIPTMQEIYVFVRAGGAYIWNYFNKKTFLPFQQVLANTRQTVSDAMLDRRNLVATLHEPSLPVQIAYIPYINLIGGLDLHSQNRFHIINGICITILSILVWMTGYYQFQIFLFFLVFFGWGYLKHKEYVFPFLYDIFALFSKMGGKIFSKTKQVAEDGKQVQEVRFQVNDDANIASVDTQNTPQASTLPPVAAIPTARTQTGAPIPKMEIPAMNIPQNPDTSSKNVFDQIGRPQTSPTPPMQNPPQNPNTPPQQ